MTVNDDPLVAADIAEEMRDNGFEIVDAPASVAEALAVISKDTRFDLAVLDINLAGETVYPVADELVARDRPFIFLTGYDKGFIPPAHAAMPRFAKPLTQYALRAMMAYLKRFSAIAT